MPTLQELADDFSFLEGDERTQMLIELGRALEPMPNALKTDNNLVRGCQAKVWVYPVQRDQALHFFADSESVLTKGMIGLVLAAVQDQSASTVAALDIPVLLKPFQIEKHLTSLRTSGLLNMIALVQATARRFT